MAERIVRLLALECFGTLFDARSGLTSVLSAAFIPNPDQVAVDWIRITLDTVQELASQQRFAPFPEVIADALTQALQSVGLTIDNAGRMNLTRAWANLPVFSDVRPALERWMSLGTQSWIVTNGDLDGVQALLEENGLTDLIQGIVTAGSVRQFKPCPELYERASAAAGALPGQIVMASAQPLDVMGAGQVGYGTAWVNRDAIAPAPAGFHPEFNVPDLQSLVDLLLPLAPRREPGSLVF